MKDLEKQNESNNKHLLLQTIKDFLENGVKFQNIEEKSMESFKMNFTKQEKKFIDANIDKWVNSAYLAKQYVEKRQYTIEDSQVVPVDNEHTGVFQRNSHLGDGLQQFLEMKHELDITPLYLTTNYKSNVSFFKRYIFKTIKDETIINIYGLTGTLGSHASLLFCLKNK